jgi:cytochrome P450
VTATDLYWDPFTPALRDDPYPLWRRLRDEAPVWRNDRHDFWVLSRFDDVEGAHKDPVRFSSAHGITLEQMTPEPRETGMVIQTDPPKHTVLRKLVSRAFTVRRMSLIEDRIRDVCARLLDPHLGGGRFDFVQDFSAILPPTIISSLLGVPESDQEHLRKTVDAVFHIEDDVGMMNPISRQALIDLQEYLIGQFAERETDPRDDVFTDLVQADVTDEDGTTRKLTPMERAEFGTLLFAAGSETVARHLGWAVSTLDAYPDQRAELASDFSLIPNAIEEVLRFEAPSPVQGRWTKADVELHGTTIPEDSRVVLITGSADRDERKYENPDVFDIHRAIDVHVAFGYGIHFCLGAALARLEGRIGVEETLKRWPEWSVDRDAAKLLYTSTVRGYDQLPIEV